MSTIKPTSIDQLKIKIAIIGSKGLPAKYGGVQVVVEQLAKELVKNGNSVTVYARKYYSANKSKRFLYEGIKVINISGINTKRLDTISHSFISALYATFGDYDIVVFHSIIPAFFSFIPKIFGKKTVLHSHGLIDTIAKWSKLEKLLVISLARASSYFLDRVTTVAQTEVTRTSQIFHKNVSVIPNGFNFKPLPPSTSPQKYFLFVGRIVPGKGLDTLINAFNEFCKQNNDYELRIIGEQVHSSSVYNKLISLSKINDHIKWLGPVYNDKLISYYQNAFAIINPSTSESFSITTIEAIAYNGFVISSDLVQIKSIFKDHLSYFEVNNSTSLFNTLIEVTKDMSIRQKFILHSRDFNFYTYDWSIISKLYYSYYSSLLQ